MAINGFSLIFLLLCGLKQGILFHETYSSRKKSLETQKRFILSCIISCISLFPLTLAINYNGASIPYTPLLYISIAGFFTVVSFLIALFSMVVKLGYIIGKTVYAIDGFYSKFKIVIYPLLAILLVYPVEFYLNPWLDQLTESQAMVWEAKKSWELAFAFDSGLLFFMMLWWVGINNFVRVKTRTTARNILDFWYSLSAFGVLGYEAAIVITRAKQAEKGSMERIVAWSVFLLMSMVILYTLVKVKKKEVT
ncbi:hypothetical protein [Mucilaginibacter sp. UYCu711]|uniref:hypothetical protein n=1 Tax=Mucilaginibacter sp. UYCu711 TaxID=3156339 RepID=UPI003D222D1B